MSKLRISIVQYLNTVPLVWGFTHGPLRGKYELSFTVPSQCAEALRTGAADIAIIPAIEYQRIDNLVILPDLAIASKKQVRSLLLVSKVPIKDARQIALDKSSRSTQALVKILCDRHWKMAPEYYEAAPDAEKMLEVADAALVIGDPALRLAISVEQAVRVRADGEWICTGANAGMPGVEALFVYDIVTEWHKMTKLPAVLAIWAGRREIVTSEVVEDFHNSRQQGLRHIPDIAIAAAKELGLPAVELERYLIENINFSLGKENLAGLTHYFALAAQMGLIPKLNQMTIAASDTEPMQFFDFVWAKRETEKFRPMQ